MSRIFCTDKEVCSVLEINPATLRRMLSGIVPRNAPAERRIDIRAARPVCVNGRRRWRLKAVAEVLGVSPEEIERRLE